MNLSSEQRIDWLRLIRTDGIGPATFRQLIDKFGDADKAIAQAPALARARGRRNIFKIASKDQINAELDQADYLGARFIASCEPAYPAPVKAISDAPPVLCVKGDPELLAKNTIGIVGARNASAAGRKIARDLAKDLGANGLVIASGLARGIDGAAHQAALATGTIAVVAGGIDVIYPPEHADLTNEICQRGLVISEMPLGYQPKGRDFPRRNRLISGLSLGVIIVEAALRSGTLITARCAMEQGRDVFAIPGSPLDPRSQGTNKLIRDGATLIQSAGDVIEAIQAITARVMEPQPSLFEEGPAPIYTPAEEAQAERTLRELLSFTPAHKDMLIRDSALPPSLVAAALLNLVLSGLVAETGGGHYVRSTP